MRMILALSLSLAACGPGLATTESSDGSDDAGSSVSVSASGSSASGSSASGSADDSGPGVDGCDGLCITMADPGDPWRGPVGIATVEDITWSECPSGSPSGIAKFGHQLVDSDEPCACTCALPSPLACSAPVAVHEAAGCEGEVSPTSVGRACLLVEGASIRLEPPALDETCAPGASLPSASYDLFTALCEPESTPSCGGGGRCVPTTGLDDVVCWWAPGELECPPELPDRRIVYSATDDQRTCAEGCGCTGTPTCAGVVVPHESCREAPPEPEPLLPGDCIDLAGPLALWSDFEIEGECTPMIPSVPVIGEVLEDAPQTLCCTAG